MSVQPERRIAEEVSPEEWQVRVDLAALYRLVALWKWDDLIFTHVSASVPGEDGYFLINPLGLMFDEVTASSLVKVDLDGNAVGDTGQAINRAGFVIHSTVHAAREDARFVMHLHTDDGMAVAAHREGLLPLGQMSLLVIPRLAYHDYEGIAFDLEESDRLVADLGDRDLMLLRHHGTLSLGRTAAEAWIGMYYLERACSVQVRALSGGQSGVVAAPLAAQDKVMMQRKGNHGSVGSLVWDSMLRKISRESPGFDR
ncbi:MAG TPA: class II aldolase/adducin family protein [Novosphingobium sp.]|nr:class II aldolase/adducin family protein [Novosphingobium sp.]